MSQEKIILTSIGRCGWSIFYAAKPDGGTVVRSGYGDENTPGPHGDSVREAIASGAPLVDSRTVPDDKITRLVISGPMVAQRAPDAYREGVGLDGCGYGSLSYAPIDVYVALYRKYGARVLNSEAA